MPSKRKTSKKKGNNDKSTRPACNSAPAGTRSDSLNESSGLSPRLQHTDETPIDRICREALALDQAYDTLLRNGADSDDESALENRRLFQDKFDELDFDDDAALNCLIHGPGASIEADVALLRGGTEMADRQTLENRRIFGEKFRALVVAEEDSDNPRMIDRFNASTKLPLSNADEEDATECPICFDPILNRGIDSDGMRHLCCGKIMCSRCRGKRFDGQVEDMESSMRRMMLYDENCLDRDERMNKLSETLLENINQCVFCRQQMPMTEHDMVVRLRSLAKGGLAWAQCRLSRHLFGDDKNDEGLLWLQKAVAQEYGPAEHLLGVAMMEGRCGLAAGEDDAEALRLIENAAHKGDSVAQLTLAQCKIKSDWDEGMRWCELSAAGGYHQAQERVGYLLAESNLPDLLSSIKSPSGSDKMLWGEELLDSLSCHEGAIYWYKKAAEQSNYEVQSRLALLLISRAKVIYGSARFAGYSPIPEAFRWACTLLNGGHEGAAEIVDLIKDIFLSACACCNKKKEDCSSFLCCAQCKAAFYCSKKCQVIHWKDGHKADCCGHSKTNKSEQLSWVHSDGYTYLRRARAWLTGHAV